MQGVILMAVFTRTRSYHATQSATDYISTSKLANSSQRGAGKLWQTSFTRSVFPRYRLAGFLNWATRSLAFSAHSELLSNQSPA